MATKEIKKDERVRNWIIVFYPESAPEDFMEIIRDWHVKAFLSPLHDQDVNPDGEPKKPHYHLLLMFSGKKSSEQIQELSDQLSGVNVLPYECAVRDCKATARYLIHMDNPEKYQYSATGVVNFSGADYLEYIQTSSDIHALLQEITLFCVENNVCALSLLQVYAIRFRPDWFRVIDSHTIYISCLLRSIYWAYQNGQSEIVIRSTGEVFTLPDMLEQDILE